MTSLATASPLRSIATARPLLLAFLFIWLPGTALLFTVHHLLVEFTEDQRSLAEVQLDSFLERAADYDDPMFFWARVCRGIDQRVMTASDSVSQLQRELRRLKHWCPGSEIRLMIWNQKDEVIRQDQIASMTKADWQSILRDLRSSASENSAETTEKVERMPGAWERLFGGGFVARRVLRYAGLHRTLVRPIGVRESARLWYGRHRRGSYILHFDAAIFRRSDGLRHLCNFPPPWRPHGAAVGCLDPQSTEQLITSNRDFQRALTTVVESKEIGLTSTQPPDWFTARRMLPSGCTLYAGIRHPFWVMHGSSLMVTLALLLIAASITGTMRLRQAADVQSGPGTSVQTKLALFFLIANGLPLLMLVMMSATQLRNREVNLLSDLRTSTAEMIRHFDEGVRVWNERTRQQVLRRLDHLEQHLRDHPFTVKEYRTLYRDMKELGAQGFILCASSSVDWVTDHGYLPASGPAVTMDRTFDPKRDKFFQEGIQRILLTLNGVATKPVDRFELVIESLFGITATEFANNLLSGLTRVTIWGDGANRQPAVVKLFRSADGTTANYVFLANFHPNTIGSQYFQSRLAGLNRNRLGLRFFTRSRVSFYRASRQPGRTEKSPGPALIDWRQFPAEIRLPAPILRHVQSLSPVVTVSARPFVFRNQSYLVIGGAGRELPEFVYFALYPYERLLTQQREGRRNLLLFGLLSLTFSFILGQTLGRRFLEPIALLHEGTQAVRRHAFTHRLPYLGHDEFGRIGTAVNSALESLEELAVARVVQENLLPDGRFESRTCQGFGRTIPMSELGGDFFDLQKTGPTSFVLSIGDVAGHGVPAALVMAMAKAVLHRLLTNGSSSECAYTELNHLLLQTPNRKARRAVSLQSVAFDDESEVIHITSAGHCYPVLLSSNDAKLLKFASTPVGVSTRSRFSTQSFEFKPGNTLVLYTDGAVEITSQTGQSLGFDGFTRLVNSCHDDDPAVFYHRLLQGLKQYRGEEAAPLDDLTLLILTRTHQPGLDSTAASSR